MKCFRHLLNSLERKFVVWMDRVGNIVEECDASGCKVTNDITLSEYILVMDEVGGNTRQRERIRRWRTYGMRSREDATKTRSKYFTLLPITTLNSELVMCVIIFSGKKENTLSETGLDLSAEFIGDLDNPYFFGKNSGKGKAFTGGPSCHFRGKDTSYLCRWTENGSITVDILREILATLDTI